MRDGLYESPLTARLRKHLEGSPQSHQRVSRVPEADAAELLVQHAARAIRGALVELHTAEDRVRAVNRILEGLGVPDEVLDPDLHILQRVAPDIGAGVITYPDVRPAIPLGETALLTNARNEPQLGHELRAEIDTSDKVDLLCAFVKWQGLRLLEEQLGRLRERSGTLRVVTTTYIGATDPHALRRLIEQFDAEIKVQYDIRRTRLHAKAWLFRRNTGFDTAYVGSSNLSKAALLEGLEWNVRLSSVATPALISKFRATFDSYWAEETFEPYYPDRDEDRLKDALAEASGRRTTDRVTVSLSGLDVRPYPHQTEMLEALDAERKVHDRHRNLLVAATGTGKTVVAALDYRRLREQAGGKDLSLLFVAHRGEILTQSLRTYREVLSDGSFGESYHGGDIPTRWRHVFASVQSFARLDFSKIRRDAYDVVVIDEFHHAAAPTYRKLLDHLLPKELLGLTATPERTDGYDVRQFFGGRSAHELRVWDALDADLLVPFHYFGIADETDLTRIEWKRGRYDEAQLSSLFTGNDARARIVLNQVRDKVGDLDAMRAVGFCVSVDHAHYMASVFRSAGIPSAALTGGTSADERASILQQLREGKLNAVFAVDVLNEGVDIPEIDTVLFLRPTESATVFIQQLGRGLRHSDSKAVLTALDFVGMHRKEFRFDKRFRALTGANRSGIRQQVEDGFPFLPAGSQIMLDPVSRNLVLQSIRSQLSLSTRELIWEARSTDTESLRDFLETSGLELGDVLRSGSPPRTWTTIKRDAGLPTPVPGPIEQILLKRVRALAHVDDPERADTYVRLLRGQLSHGSLTPLQQAHASMLYYSVWPSGGGFSDVAAGIAELRAEPAVCAELAEVIDLSMDHTGRFTRVPEELPGTPLRVHAQYQREEILAGLGWVQNGRTPNNFREGVIWVEELKSDAFFVTLKKSEREYSATTLYRDFALSPTLFHWESQSTTSVDSKTGQRYIQHRDRGTNILIFVREAKDNDLGTSPYVFLGPAEYVSHEGDRPIAFTWRLKYQMPMELFLAASAVAA
jgi:superfamily II DNA or RNA helicase/HKD family nuclease